MRHRHAVAVDMVAGPVTRLPRREVGDDLVAVEVKIDPLVARSSLRTAHRLPIESARGGEIVDGKGEVERGQGHCRPHSARAAPEERVFLQRTGLPALLPCAPT